MGIILNSLVTFILYLVNPVIQVYLYGDLDFFIGTIVGVIFAIKNREVKTPALKFAIIVGIFGGLLAAFIINFYTWILYSVKFGEIITWFIYFMGVVFLITLMTAIFIGLIVGGLIGYFYAGREIREGEEREVYDNSFDT